MGRSATSSIVIAIRCIAGLRNDEPSKFDASRASDLGPEFRINIPRQPAKIHTAAYLDRIDPILVLVPGIVRAGAHPVKCGRVANEERSPRIFRLWR